MKDKTLTLRTIISHYGHDKQTDMAIEEMSELTKALLKWRRADMVHTPMEKLKSLHSNIAEEIADVQIMLEQLILIYGVGNAVNEWIEQKIERTLERIKENERGL